MLVSVCTFVEVCELVDTCMAELVVLAVEVAECSLLDEVESLPDAAGFEPIDVWTLLAVEDAAFGGTVV